jgi:GT2 family glycosyltransferase
MKTPLVYIVVLNYNGVSWLKACLTSLLATTYSNFKVLLVDNASADGSVDFVLTAFPQVQIIQNDHNLGFSEGNNVGIELALTAGADYVVLLNPDTKVPPNWLAKLIEIGEAESAIGILGPVQNCYDNDEPNAWTKAVATPQLAQFGALNAMPVWLAVEWVEGSCFVVKREVFRQVGYLDPIYYSFYEEIDFCRRAACAGYQIALVPKTHIHHHRGGIWAVQRNRKRDYLCDRGQFIYALTDPRRSLLRNLAWWFVTLRTKLKELLWPLDFIRLVNLIQIQTFLVTHGTVIYNKWKREQLLIQ